MLPRPIQTQLPFNTDIPRIAPRWLAQPKPSALNCFPAQSTSDGSSMYPTRVVNILRIAPPSKPKPVAIDQDNPHCFSTQSSTSISLSRYSALLPLPIETQSRIIKDLRIVSPSNRRPATVRQYTQHVHQFTPHCFPVRPKTSIG